MAATRQGEGSSGGRPTRSGATRRSAGARGSGARTRRPAPPPSKPAWLWVAMIGGPLLLLAGLLVFQATRSSGGGGTASEDPNARITELEGEVRGMAESYREFVRLTQSESPRAAEVREKLEATIEKWTIEWDGIFNAHRDAEDRLPPGLQAYQRSRADVQQIRLDLLKSSGN